MIVPVIQYVKEPPNRQKAELGWGVLIKPSPGGEGGKNLFDF